VRNGGEKTNRKLQKREKQTRTKGIKTYFKSCIPCCYTNYAGCYELWHLSDCETEVEWRENNSSIPGLSKHFSLFHRVHFDSATHPAAVSTWVNRSYCEAHYRPPKIRVARICTSLQCVFLEKCLSRQGCCLAFNIVVVFLCAVQISLSICLSLSLSRPFLTLSFSHNRFRIARHLLGTEGVPISVRRWFAAVYERGTPAPVASVYEYPALRRSELHVRLFRTLCGYPEIVISETGNFKA
jgi:hypothetical protein